MDLIQNLLVLYGGVILINVALSAVLWHKYRSRLNAYLFLAWASSVLTTVVIGATTGTMWVTIGFASVFAVNLSLAKLLGSVVGLEVSHRHFVAIWLGGLLLGLVLLPTQVSFTAKALPIVVSVAVPLLHTSIRVLRRRRELTVVGWGLLVSCVLYGLHNLDFAVLGADEEFQALGFTLALLVSFALTSTAPAFVLERVTAERAQIEQLHMVRSRFFDNISHEIRTPLTLILSPVQDALARIPDEEIRDSLELVQSNAVRLLQLIDELLDLSRIDAGGLRLNIGLVELSGMTRTLGERYRRLIEEKNIEFELDLPAETEDLYGDAHRIEMIIANLIGNAFKYTPAGGRVTVRLREVRNRHVLEVEDTGPGMSPAEAEKVFERFYRIQDGSRADAGGVGIGLSLAHELTELHGGSLSVRSKLGEGTCFSLSLLKGREHFDESVVERRERFVPSEQLPLVREETKTTKEESRDSPVLKDDDERSRVLIVEDRDEMRIYLRRVLEEHYEVLVARDGLEGLAVVRRERPDIVVSDVMMPGADGTELCRQIKSDPELRSTPVIFLTARLGSEVTLEAYAHGANDFVTKPFHPKVLLARVKAQLELRAMTLQVSALEKFASIGSLAGGMAHEIRNPINSILNASRLLQSSDLDDDTRKTLTDVVVDGASRISGILEALESYARPAEGASAQRWSAREGIESTLRLLGQRMDEVTVEIDCADDYEAKAPPGVLNQVMTNLIENAMLSGGRRIRISVFEEGSELVVRVADDGPGVPPQYRRRIFDPFFTTRAVGDGSGLGLYICRRFLGDYGGRLVLLPQRSGEGATFQVTVPSERREVLAS